MISFVVHIQIVLSFVVIKIVFILERLFGFNQEVVKRKFSENRMDSIGYITLFEEMGKVTTTQLH